MLDIKPLVKLCVQHEVFDYNKCLLIIEKKHRYSKMILRFHLPSRLLEAYFKRHQAEAFEAFNDHHLPPQLHTVDSCAGEPLES